MAAYRRVYDSRHLQADCQEPGSAPTLGNRVWATFTFSTVELDRQTDTQRPRHLTTSVATARIRDM